MIKLIIFDLDGVLYDSKDIHFRALNKALMLSMEPSITYERHIAEFDGLPTKDKMAKLGISGEKALAINILKQDVTAEMLEDGLAINKDLVDLFKRLKSEGYKLYIASNSIRYTVALIAFKLGIYKYLDGIMSNEDVSKGKPHSEMYLKCMLSCGVNPSETLILEDSYVGRQGVHNSGAFLCPINKPEDVKYEHIFYYIDKYEGVVHPWKGLKMNILIPMAGAGSRFSSAGFTFPKPLIEVSGKPMIQVVVENLNIEARYIYVVQKEHYDKYNLKYMLEIITPGCVIVQTEGVTEGAACTTLLAKEFINSDSELLIANSDQWVNWDSSDFMYAMQGDTIDGGILTFENTHPKWSYVKEHEGFICDVQEKKVISNKATVGIYYWKKGSDYVKYAEDMISNNIRVNNEFYVAPVYNSAIQDGRKIKSYNVDKMLGLGTPEDLDFFLKTKLI